MCICKQVFKEDLSVKSMENWLRRGESGDRNVYLEAITPNSLNGSSLNLGVSTWEQKIRNPFKDEFVDIVNWEDT